MEIGLLLFAYLIGSIPFGLMITRICGVPDIRKMGSGNIGATNVMRMAGKHLGACTLVLDMVKGVIPVALMKNMTPDVTWWLLATLFAIGGHIFSIWLKFKGGKGVATAIGAYLALSPLFGASVVLVWLLAVKQSRYVSIGAVVAFAVSPVIAALTWLPMMVEMIPNYLILCVVAALVIYRHKSNLAHIREGVEPKLGE